MPKYRMIIVDDEYFNRKQLLDSVDWSLLDFQIIDSFASYDDALAFLSCTPVDVLFTDIRLGNHNGIELARESRIFNPDMETVLISAFSEFDYARNAITIEAFDYLLKPVLPNKITDCFVRLHKKLEHKRLLREEIQEHSNLVRCSFYHDIFTGMITTGEEAECLARENHFDPELKSHGYLLLQLSDEEKGFKNRPLYGYDSMTTMIRHFSSRVGDSYTVYAVSMEGQQLYLLAIFSPAELSEQNLSTFPARFCDDFKAVCGFDIRCLILDKDTDLLALAGRFREKRMPPPATDNVIAKIKEYIKSGEADSAVHLFQNAAAKFEQNSSVLHPFICTLLDGITENESPSAAPIHAYLSHLDDMDTEQMIKEFCTLLYQLSSEMSGLSYNEYYISYAKKYVADHISEDISLEKVAESVALSPAYFSRYFRELTGIRFIDYLCQMRVEHAKELLLQPDVKLADVYQLVGYHSRSRFYSLFFDKTGMTPHEYRKSHLNET